MWYAGYRTAVYFLHRKLGKKKVVQIPSCVGENLNISSVLFIILSGAIKRALLNAPGVPYVEYKGL